MMMMLAFSLTLSFVFLLNLLLSLLLLFIPAAVAEVGELTSNLANDLKQIGNFLKLTELQRDLVGMDNLVQPGRVCIHC